MFHVIRIPSQKGFGAVFAIFGRAGEVTPGSAVEIAIPSTKPLSERGDVCWSRFAQ